MPQIQETRRGRINIIPYVHKVSHGLKKIGQKAGIRTVFSAPNKIGKVCKVLNVTLPNDTRHSIVYFEKIFLILFLCMTSPARS